MSGIFLLCNSYQNIILLKKDWLKSNGYLSLSIDSKIIGNINYSKQDNEAPLLNINQICNADFELNTQYWHLSKQIPADFKLGIDSTEDWVLEDGHTAFLLQGSLYKESIELIYQDPVFGEFLPVEPDNLYLIAGSFACHRCDGFFIVEFFNKQQKKLQQQKINILTNKRGGKKLEDYHTIREQITSPETAAFARLSLLKLPTEGKEKNSLLFFTQLFFASTSKESVSFLAWNKCPFSIEEWIEHRKNNFEHYIKANIDLPHNIYDGEKHIISINDAQNSTPLIGSPKSFKLTDQGHKTITDCHSLALKEHRHHAAKQIQNILNNIATCRFKCIIDGFSNTGKLQGWLSDKIHPRQIITLELHEKGEIIASTTNKELHATYGKGMFIFSLPNSILDGHVHHFSLYIKEYSGYLGTWNFITPSFPTQSSQQLVCIESPLWKDIPETKIVSGSNTQKKQSTSINKNIEQIALELAELDEEDKNARYQLNYQLGGLLLADRKLEQALNYFYAAMQQTDAITEAFVNYIETLVRLGREHDAEIAISTALNNNPTEVYLLERRDKLAAAKRPKSAKVLAFYLPQFHPIPENDQWWGRGFTEWINVTSATALFDGHLQPRRPAGLGYYDLRLPETANAQFDLARRYSIDGFCYYYYWFHGRRVLERPLQDLVSGKTGPFPFCICWANEDWTRSWDGQSGEVLLAQDHTPESDFKFIKDLTPLLKHPDYIRIDDKPIILVYRADKLATPKETLEKWRTWCRKKGIGELHLCMVQSFNFADDPRSLGFDAAVEFPPHSMEKKYPELVYRQQATSVKGLDEGFKGNILDYQVYAKASMKRPSEPYTLHRSCFLAWDNTARRGKSADVFHHFTVSAYQQWLAKITTKNAIQQTTGITFINAWNEWAEGATLEPDNFFGYELLEQTYRSKMLMAYSAQNTYWQHGQPQFYFERIETSERILLIGHDAHFNGAQINLLNMARCLRRDLSMQVIIVLIEGGVLLPDYEQAGQTLVVGRNEGWQDTFIEFINRYTNFGTHKAISNTVVTGEIVELLHQHNYRVVSLVHELPALIESYALQAACWQIADKADHIVFASKIVADSFCNRYWPQSKKILIAPQGIVLNPYHLKRDLLRTELREDLNLPADVKIIMGCGYGDTRKGIDLFVQMAGEVKRHYGEKSVAFIWVGELEHSIKPYIVADIERLKLTDNFHVTGKTNNPARYYIASDMFALTSREDPFPSVVMEAFDAKLPVIAFDGGGGYVDIVNDKTGALVPYIDVAAMSAAILKLLNDDVLRLQIGDYCHQLCREHFTYKPYLKKLLALLNNVPTEQVAAGLLKRQAWFENTPRPTITAIVPNYNYGRYLELRLRTVLDQTLAPTEIIILDDASTDYSLELINAFAGQTTIPVHVISNDTNTGNTFAQWAKGLALAQGELVWIAEADDYCEPTLLETLAKEFVDASVNLAWTDSIIVDDLGQSEGFQYKKYYSQNYGVLWNSSFRMSGQKLIEKCLLVANIVPNASAALFRRTAAENNFDLITHYQFSGDWWFWISVAQTGDVVYCADALNYHRRHSLSVMGEVLADENKFLAESLQFFQRIVKHKPELLTAKVSVQILERLESMYKLFPKLTAAYPRFMDHPDFYEPYQALFSALKPEQALFEIYTKTPVTLVISEDAMQDSQTTLSLVHSLRVKHNLQLIMLADDKNEPVIEQCKDSVQDTVVIKPTLDRTILAQLDSPSHKQVFTFGLLAHIYAYSLFDKNMPVPEWTILAGKEFDSLLGQLPANPDITIAELQQALKQCSDIQFIGDNIPYPLEIMAKPMLIPIDKLTLLPVHKTSSDPEKSLYFLGVAPDASIETWQLVSEVLQQIEETEHRKMVLRILAWDANIKQVEELVKNKNVEIITIFEKPSDFSTLADVGIVPNYNSTDTLDNLYLEFKQCSMDTLTNNELFMNKIPNKALMVEWLQENGLLNTKKHHEDGNTALLKQL